MSSSFGSRPTCPVDVLARRLERLVGVPEQRGGVCEIAHPVALVHEESPGLHEDLLIGLVLGDAIGKVGGVGVNLGLSR